ncbi:GNAT family N-acetyltransferase [Pseudalkalibacillus caeni]|uniref:GNAT family N-acetyltransferase n=1 Tax=Exobacillus caeni TaxID=2574798 RepID=A0A5R9F027_9BACL|nr:GNAT family N-acetyltransferase [Pseudalkalibacillus caeni]TLS36049.1 GNAT family N-acetyltransferase [Pseudalkalibacillus caeni]
MLLLQNPDQQEKTIDGEELQFQIFRMQENMKQIAKKWEVIGIDQTKDDSLVIVYAFDDGKQCKIMLNECDSAFQGNWDFSIQATYKKDNRIHIGDIKGPSNRGYGSICMNYLKERAKDNNIPTITGDIAERDWGHVDRLIHFYEKHNFDVMLDKEDKSGEIVWSNHF